MLAEVLPTGSLITSWNIQTVELLTVENVLMLILKIIVILFAFYYTLEEFYEMFKFRLAYCKKLWNIVDLAVALVSIAKAGLFNLMILTSSPG